MNPELVDTRHTTGAPSGSRSARKAPTLIFFTRPTSGPARRMESVIAHFARKERRRLHVVRVDVDENVEFARKLAVDEVPTLVLVKDKRPVERLLGRATGAQIERMIEAHVA